jgi:hypothetical protein
MSAIPMPVIEKAYSNGRYQPHQCKRGDANAEPLCLPPWRRNGKRVGDRFLNNLPKRVMYEWISWCDNANGLFDDFPDHNYRKLQVPLLAFSFSNDWRSQQSGVKALLQHFSSACITWYHVNPTQIGKRSVGHSGFFKTYSQKTLWQSMLNWIGDKKCDGTDGILSIKKECFSQKEQA